MFSPRSLLPALTLAAFAALAVSAAAQEGGMPAGQPDPPMPSRHAPEVPAQVADDAAILAAQKPSYPLQVCVVSGDALGADSLVEVVREGRYVALCSADCVQEFDKAPADHLRKIDAAVVAAQKPGYPLKTCVVRGDELTEAKTKDVVVGTRLALVCCSNCKKKLVASPQAYFATIDAALVERQQLDYALTTCPVSDETLDDPVVFLHGTTLVKTCCKDCKKEFAKDPAPYLAKLAAARAARAGAADGAESAPAKPADGGPKKNG